MADKVEPVVYGTADDEQTKREESASSDSTPSMCYEEQWAVVFTIVSAAHCCTSVTGVTGTLSFWVGWYFLRSDLEIECDHKVWIVSMVIFSTRAVDATFNLCNVFVALVPTRQQFLCQLIVTVVLTTLQTLLAIVQTVVASVSFSSDGKDCDWLISLYLAAGICLIVWNLTELPLWIFLYFAWKKAPTTQKSVMSKNVRKYVPESLKEKVHRTVELEHGRCLSTE